MLEEVQSVVVPREDITVYVGQEGREEGELGAKKVKSN